MPQGHASIGGAGVALLRAVAVVVAVPQSKIEIDFALLQDPRSSERIATSRADTAVVGKQHSRTAGKKLPSASRTCECTAKGGCAAE